jgi:hypothetical protein
VPRPFPNIELDSKRTRGNTPVLGQLMPAENVHTQGRGEGPYTRTIVRYQNRHDSSGDVVGLSPIARM